MGCEEGCSDAVKHGVSFDEAATIFVDPDALDGPDVRHSAKETRFLRLGRSVLGQVLMIAYTLRRSANVETIRIISARGPAVKKEPLTAVARKRKIDFSEIPEASTDQLRAMRRVCRPPIGDAARQLIAIRLDPDVLKHLRTEAKRTKVGYQTLINRVLADYTRKHVA